MESKALATYIRLSENPPSSLPSLPWRVPRFPPNDGRVVSCSTQCVGSEQQQGLAKGCHRYDAGLCIPEILLRVTYCPRNKNRPNYGRRCSSLYPNIIFPYVREALYGHCFLLFSISGPVESVRPGLCVPLSSSYLAYQLADRIIVYLV